MLHLYLEHAARTTRAILRLQNRRPPYPDWRGSYYNPPRSTPTATRSEGLAAAYLLTRDFGQAAEAARLLEGLELGVRFQLGTQFGPESVLYLPDPRRALGGFRRGLNHYEIRIDYVQHNISALLLLRRILALGDRTSDAAVGSSQTIQDRVYGGASGPTSPSQAWMRDPRRSMDSSLRSPSAAASER